MRLFAIGLVCALLALAGAFRLGARYEQGRQAERDNKQFGELQLKYEGAFDENNRIAAELETARAERQIVYRDITKNVIRYIDRPVYHTACLDADGLRDANAALAGKRPDPGQPADTVPGPHDLGGGHR
jgi:hypothetical protein